MNPDFIDLLRAFGAADVRFLIVGAYALAAHGRPRATGDLDVWIDATPDNARDVADRTWDLVHDRDENDPVKQRVVECHEALARMTRLGD